MCASDSLRRATETTTKHAMPGLDRCYRFGCQHLAKAWTTWSIVDVRDMEILEVRGAGAGITSSRTGRRGSRPRLEGACELPFEWCQRS